MFETLHTSAVFISMQPLLTLLASGRATGIVVESGEVTYTVPFHNALPILEAINRLDVGGRDLTNHLSQLLTEHGYPFTTSGEREIARNIKETLCYVASDFEEEMHKFLQSRDIEKTYELPDGNIVIIGAERFGCPEALFRPSLIGIEPTLPPIVDSIPPRLRENRSCHLFALPTELFAEIARYVSHCQ
jgi:actin beta/gamma 1